MDRFTFERYDMVISNIRYESFDGGDLVDDYEDEEKLYLWAIYDSREGHMRPIGYMHTADQAQQVCDALNHRGPSFDVGCMLTG